MSKKYKVNSVRQADDAINDLNDELNQSKREIAKKITEAQQRATREAENRARDIVQKERARFNEALGREISGVKSSINDLDKAHRQRLLNTKRELESVIDKRAEAVRAEAKRGLDNVQKQLRDTEAANRDRANKLNSRIDVANKRIDAANSRIDVANKRIDAANSRIDAANTRIDLVNELSRARFDSVRKSIAELADNTLRMFDRQQQQLNSQQGQLDNHRQRLDSLTSAVNGILRRLSNDDQRRREAVDMAKAIYEAAFRRTPIDRFNPEEASRIHDRMRRLMADPDSPAATSLAIESIMNIEWAEEKALKEKIVYDAILAQAMESLDAVLQEVNTNRNVEVSLTGDPADAVAIETDFWNRGEFNQLEQRLREIRRELETEPTIDRIRELSDEMAACQVKSADMVGKAAERSILSENRVAITEDIVTALQQQGWQVERSPEGVDEVGYEGGEIDNDWREGVFAYLRSLNGERIVIRITPSDNERDNDIAFHRIDNRSLTSAEFMRSLLTMKAQIERSGHKLGDFRAPEADGGDATLAEVTSSSRLSKKGAAQNIRRKMRGQ